MKAFFARNGLLLVALLAFGTFFVGQTVTGHRVHNEDQRDHGQATISLPEYLTTGHFLEATMEKHLEELGDDAPQDRDPLDDVRPDSPRPVRRGKGVALSQQQQAHGGGPVGPSEFLRSADFWFQSMQNWQSEFLAVAAIVFLSIYLRQQGSHESKPVAAPHAKTGA